MNVEIRKRKYYRKGLLAISLLLVFTSCRLTIASDTVETKKTNIIFIVADDLGWSDLSGYGTNIHKTPNLDRMAKQGIKFTNAYASAPVCSPTRASILTGKYPASLNLTDFIPGRQNRLGLEPDKMLKTPEFEQQLNLSEQTLAEVLKKIGYSTISIGKWHLGDIPYYPTTQGFDANIGGNHRGYPPTFLYPYEKLTSNGGSLDLNDVKAKAKKGEYLTDALTSIALDFIQENKDKPIFLIPSLLCGSRAD